MKSKKVMIVYDDEESRVIDTDQNLNSRQLPFKYLVIDCAPINYIDTTGVNIVNKVNY